MKDSPEGRKRQSRLGGLSRASRMTPEERTAHMSAMGKASAAKRAAVREAAGNPPPRPRSESTPLPSAEELAPYLEEIDAEPREVPLSYDSRFREATLRLRLDVARLAIKYGAEE